MPYQNIMNSHSLVILLLLLCALFCVQSVEGSKNLEEENDAAVELNPDYVEPSETTKDIDKDDDEESDGDDGDEVETFDASKGAIAQALLKSRKQSRKAKKFVKKNRSKITTVLTVFAFRREIRQVLLRLATKQLVDPKTGKLRLNLTATLKLLLFVDFMRRMQKGGGSNSSSSSLHALSAIGQSNPLAGILFSKVLHLPVYNPAYIPSISQHYTFERVNERYVKDGMALHKAIHAKHEGFKWPTSDSSITRKVPAKSLPPKANSNETVVIIDLTNLDQSVSTMESLRDQVSFLLSQYRAAALYDEKSATENATSPSLNSTVLEQQNPNFEVVVILESPGGSAADYGLAAQQLLRLRNEPGINMTICVDKVAASGGYMLACTASPGRLLAAPFAVVGSIGVIGQIVNIHKLLEGWGISPLVFRGGKDKAPIGLIGEVTRDGKELVQSMIDDIHRAFKRHVVAARPALEKKMKSIGNGDVYLGYDALDLGLVDRISTSDEYISEKVEAGARVLKLVKIQRYRFLFGRRYDTASELRQVPSFGDIATRILAKASNLFGVGLKGEKASCIGVQDMRLAVSTKADQSLLH